MSILQTLPPPKTLSPSTPNPTHHMQNHDHLDGRRPQDLPGRRFQAAVEANAGQESETTPIDLVTVLDVSTSMEVPKLLVAEAEHGGREEGFGGRSSRNGFRW
jgi:hypothetical protein